MDKITIVVAEDHPLVRLGTVHLLEQNEDFVVVGSAEDGQQALDLLEKFHPDILLCDIRMPKVDGIEVVRRMKTSSPNTKAIMLTAHDDEDYVVSLLRDGVSGYLLKTTDARELAQCIRAAHLGATVVHPRIASTIARASAQDHNKPQMERLSTRERAILQMLADGVRNPEIAQKLGLSVRTVEGHINRLFTKLAVSSRAEAVNYVRSHGITDQE